MVSTALRVSWSPLGSFAWFHLFSVLSWHSWDPSCKSFPVLEFSMLWWPRGALLETQAGHDKALEDLGSGIWQHHMGQILLVLASHK